MSLDAQEIFPEITLCFNRRYWHGERACDGTQLTAEARRELKEIEETT
jgi:hypothetical protein